jgi:signal transduction histidine kinase
MLRDKDAEIELRNMQVAYRGYLLSPEKRYLAELADAQNKFARDLGEIEALVGDNSNQERILLKTTELKETWVNAVERLVDQRDLGTVGSDALRQIQTQAQAVFDSIEDFVGAERQLRAQRIAHQQAQYQVLFLLIPILSLVVIIVLSYWGWRQIQLATEQFRTALDSAERARAESEKAGERAEKANRAKDNFLGTVSHELRNPLNSILLWSTALLRDQSLSEGTRRGVTAIERAIRVQGQLIEDLLDISRIESGRLRLDVQNVDLAEA